MSCSNTATLVRFVGRVTVECPVGDPDAPFTGIHTFNSITKIGGLDLGEEGTVTVPDWGANAIIADGVRVFQPLSLQFRVPYAPFEAGSDFKTIADMFARRARFKYTWEIFITDRSFRVLFIFKFHSTDMKQWKLEDQELGQAKVGLIDTTFLPYDVDLRDCLGNVVIPGKPTVSLLSLTC